VLNAILLEIECSKPASKLPQGPGKTAPEPPKQASPIEVGRSVSAVLGRRKKLRDAHDRYLKLMAKAATASPNQQHKIAHDMACQKLAVAAATSWLDFSTDRYKLMRDFAQKHGKQTPKLAKVIAYGDKQLELAQQHKQAVQAGGASPEMDDFVYDYSKNAFFKNGQPYKFDGDDTADDEPQGATPDADADAADAQDDEPEADAGDADAQASAEPQATEPQATETPPEPAPAAPAAAPVAPEAAPATDAEPASDEKAQKKYTPDSKLSSDQIKQIVKEINADVAAIFLETPQGFLLSTALTAAYKKHFDFTPPVSSYAIISGPLPGVLNDVAVEWSLGFIATGDEKAYIGNTAASLLASAGSDLSVAELSKLVTLHVAKHKQKLIASYDAEWAAGSAIANAGTPLSAISPEDVKAIVDESAFAVAIDAMISEGESSAFLTSVAVEHHVKLKAKMLADVDLSQAALSVLAGQVSAALTYVADPSDLPAAFKIDLAEVVTAKMSPTEFNYAVMKTAAGLDLVLSPTVLAGEIKAAKAALEPEVDKKPDVLGFVADFKQQLNKISNLPPAIYGYQNQVARRMSASSAVNEMNPGWPSQVAAKYNVEWPPSEKSLDVWDKLGAATDEVLVARFDQLYLEGACYDLWDDLSKKKSLGQHSAVQAVFANHAIEATAAFSAAAVQALGYYDRYAYLHNLYEKWLSEKKTDDASADVSVEPSPTPAPAPAVPSPAAKKPDLEALGFINPYFWSKYKKISDLGKMSHTQLVYFAVKAVEALTNGSLYTAKMEIGPKKIAGAAKTIHAQAKQDWAYAGVTQINLDLVKKFVQAAVEKKDTFDPIYSILVEVGASGTAQLYKTKKDAAINKKYAQQRGKPQAAPYQTPTVSPTPVAAPAPLQPAAATPFDIPALYNSLLNVPDALSDWEKENILDIWQKTYGSGHTKVGVWPLTIGRQNSLMKFLAKAKSYVPAVPGAAPLATPTPGSSGHVPEVPKTASPETYQAAKIKPADNPLGMTYEEIEQFLSLTKPAGSPNPPPPSANWDGLGLLGGAGGSHAAALLGVDAENNPVEGKANRHSFWMFKKMKLGKIAFAAAEVASNRIQALLGLPHTPDVWLDKFQDKDGLWQKFPAHQKNLRQLGKESSPWLLDTPAIHSLQSAFVLNYVTSEHDDHGGNFVVTDDGALKPIDRGQAMKFFDSSHTALDYFNWQTPAGTFQDSEKGLPKKLLKHWAGGGDAPLMRLDDPAFESLIQRTEAIPSDLYKKLWRPYAEGASKQEYPSGSGGKPALGHWSTVAADKTVEGFLDGVDKRRKTVRQSIGDLFATLAKSRAQALKQKGDVRPLAEIEAEIRGQIGLDLFLGKAGKPPAVDAAPDSPWAEEAWSDPKLPATSKVPTAERLRERGSLGVDMIVGGSDLKDGRVQFYQIGDNPFSLAYLDTAARKRLNARVSQTSPPSPAPPVYPAFVPPDMPPFDDLTPKALWDRVMGAAGSSSKTIPDDKASEFEPAGSSLTKVAKYLAQWATGVMPKPNALTSYFQKAAVAAQQMATDADPLIAAAGQHYLKEFNRIGVTVEAGGENMKPASGFPEDERRIRPFTPTPEVLKAREEAKQNQQGAYQAALAQAQAAHEAQKAKIDAVYAERVKKHDAEVKALQALGTLPASKLDYWAVPGNVKYINGEGQDSSSAQSASVYSPNLTWNGNFKQSFDASTNPMTSYEIDLTSTILGKSGGKFDRIVVHYAPDQSSRGKYPGRVGQLRICYPKDSTSEQIRDYTRRVYQTLGIEAKPATAEEQELTYLRRMAWLRKLEGYKAPDGVTIGSEPDGTTAAKIKFWIDKFKEAPTQQSSWYTSAGGLGYDPRFVPVKTPDGQLKKENDEVVYETDPLGQRKRNPFYQPVATDGDGEDRAMFRRFDMTDTELQRYVDGGISLFKRSGSLRPYRRRFLLTGGLYSTEKMNNLGLTPHGQSPGLDVETGGSNWNYLFLTVPSGLGNKGDSRSKPTHDAWMGVDPRMLAYTSVWGHHQDSYGATYSSKGHNPSARAGSLQERLLGEMIEHAQQSAEYLPGDVISYRRWLTYFNAGSQADADQMIAALKKAGIHTLGNNLPVEEVITTKSYADVMAARKAAGKQQG